MKCFMFSLLLLRTFIQVQPLMNAVPAAAAPASSCVVFVEVVGRPQGNDAMTCAGVLVNRHVVLTMANCCNMKPGYETRVLVGSTNVWGVDAEVFYMVKCLVVGHSKDDPLYTFAVLRLDRLVEYNYHTLPVLLPCNHDKWPNKTKEYEVFGYGNRQTIWDDSGAMHEKELLRGDLFLLPNSECAKLISKVNTKETLLCLGQKNQTRATIGDHGAPLIVDRMVFAMASTIWGDWSWQKRDIDGPCYFVSVLGARLRIFKGMQELLD